MTPETVGDDQLRVPNPVEGRSNVIAIVRLEIM